MPDTAKLFWGWLFQAMHNNEIKSLTFTEITQKINLSQKL